MSDQHQPQAKAPPNGLAPVEIDPAIQNRLHIFSGIAANLFPVAWVGGIEFK
jgi:hypothetical protein